LVGYLVRRGGRSLVEGPPVLPVGKVPVWFYRDKDIFGILGLSLVYYCMGAGSAMVAERSEELKISGVDLLVNMGLQFFLVGVAVAIVISRVGVVEWLGLVWRKWPWVLLLGPGAVVGMWVVFGVLMSAGYADLMESLGVEQSQETVKLFQKEQDMMVVFLMAFTAVVVAPICEEIVFRGYLYGAAKRFVGSLVSSITTGLVFSAAHGSMVSMLPLFVFGMVLAWLYEQTGSIWAPIAVHFLFNGATVTIQLLLRYGVIEMPA
jgi:membrane protease YdiL (CAAX protease family)